MINISRHRPIFNADLFGDRRIDVIGAGAIGSRVVIGLAKLGLENINVWDFDIVSDVNISNQIYDKRYVGQLKVEALRDIVRSNTGTELIIHPEKVDGTQALGSVVFLLTDTMSSRKQIWEGSLKFKPSVNLVVEARMGSNCGRVYSFNPSKPRHVAGWEATLCGDDVAEVSACGSPISVGPTAEIISGFAQWQMMRWFNFEHNTNSETTDDELDNEIIVSLQPMMMFSRKF